MVVLSIVQNVERLARLILPLVFWFSGITHLNNVFAFTISIANYQVFTSFWMVALAAAVVPMLLVVLATLIAFRVMFTAALTMSSFLMGVFVLLQFSAMARGLTIDCGCFGAVSHDVGVLSVLMAGSLFTLSTGCLFCVGHREPRETAMGSVV